MGYFFVTGKIIPSNNKKSYRVFAFTENKAKIFVGLVARKELSRLLCKEIAYADICRFAEKFYAEKIAQQKLPNFKIIPPKEIKLHI